MKVGIHVAATRLQWDHCTKLACGKYSLKHAVDFKTCKILYTGILILFEFAFELSTELFKCQINSKFTKYSVPILTWKNIKERT